MRYLQTVIMMALVILSACQEKTKTETNLPHNSNYQPVQSTQRIISLAPSFTEILHSLGLEKNIVGVTELDALNNEQAKNIGKFFPVSSALESKKRKRRCMNLRPTLILGHSYMFTEEHQKELRAFLRVVDQPMSNLEDLYLYIRAVALITKRENQAEQLIHSINNSLIQIQKKQDDDNPKRVLLITNKKPLKILGHGSFLSYTLDVMGVQNVAPFTGTIHSIDPQDIGTLAPEIIIDISGQNEIELKKITPQYNKSLVTLTGKPEWLVPGPNIVDSTRNILELIYDKKF